MITLEEIKADIKSGKCRAIYLSAGSLWFTHLESDVKAATEIGKRYQVRVHEKMLADPTVPEETKTRLRGLLSGLDKLHADHPAAFKDRGSMPTDPVGAPLTIIDNPAKFIARTESKPSFYGKHGLKAFILTHNQNCDF